MFTVKEYYRDFYGCTASVKHNKNGAELTIRTHSGRLIKKKHYSTRRGAMIAMGRMSDGWEFCKMESTGKISLALRT